MLRPYNFLSLPEVSELVILSAAGADDLRCGVEGQQVLRTRACRARAQDDKRRTRFQEREVKGG